MGGRLSPALLIALVTLTVSVVWSRPAPDGPRPTRFRVATFNIHKGADRQNDYDLDRTIEAMAALDADLIGAQEVLRNHADFACADQPALIERGLRRLTGRPWSHVYVSSEDTGHRTCRAAGRGDGAETEGLAFFAPEPIVASRSIRLSGARTGLAVRVASLPGVSVVVTHLTASRQQQAARVDQLTTLLPWVERLGPSIVVGDFNASPDSDELAPVLARYRDAWAETIGALSGTDAVGSRRVRRRIDYIFYDPRAGLSIESVDVVDTSTPPDRGEVSDHRPVVATFRRNTTKS